MAFLPAKEMIENVRREKRERDAMRVEEPELVFSHNLLSCLKMFQDKFTDATDPVVTHDQRMQQQAGLII